MNVFHSNKHYSPFALIRSLIHKSHLNTAAYFSSRSMHYSFAVNRNGEKKNLPLNVTKSDINISGLTFTLSRSAPN